MDAATLQQNFDTLNNQLGQLNQVPVLPVAQQNNPGSGPGTNSIIYTIPKFSNVPADRSFHDFLDQFEIVAQALGWTEAEKVQRIPYFWYLPLAKFIATSTMRLEQTGYS